MVLRFFKEACFFFYWRLGVFAFKGMEKGRSTNGDAVVFDSIEIFVLFSSILYVCVIAGRRMIVWQGSYQVKCT